MAHIHTVAQGEATGVLRKIYDAAIQRAGRVFGILRVMSVNPPVLRASMMIYSEIMKGRALS